MIGRLIKLLLIGKYPNEGYDEDQHNSCHDIYSFIKDRIYPEYKPQNTNYPCVVYTIDSTDPDKVKAVRSPNNVVTFDLILLSKSYAELSQLSTVIINHLHRYQNSYNSNDDDSIGFGVDDTIYTPNFGRNCPASTGDIQYMGGLQIQALNFLSGIETFDEKLKIYRNTLTFNIVYIDDLSCWGADVVLKFTDLNLMASNLGATDDPLYTQPIALNQDVNYLFTTNVLVNKLDTPHPDTISGSAYDARYNYFYQEMADNSSRPALKLSAVNPPKYNGNNYLECGSSEYLKSYFNLPVYRRYAEVTFYCVVELPGSDTASTSAAVLFKDSNTTEATGGIYFYTEVLGDPAAGGVIKFNAGGMALEDDGAGGETHRGFDFFAGIVKWPMFGMNMDLSMENPFYFAVNFKRSDDETELSGQYEWIVSSSFTRTIYGTGDINLYTDWFDTSTSTFSDHFFTFNTIHSDITNYDTQGSGTFDMNGNLNIYDFVLFPTFQTFGSNKYLQIKRQIIEKHNMWERTTN